mmetsp:Transcript_24134/g.34559  ORF Transcript_24134/g.34559 Transcript_24134/m.34559 type:complete len:113 (-) Transcript_24134:248-586(-)
MLVLVLVALEHRLSCWGTCCAYLVGTNGGMVVHGCRPCATAWCSSNVGGQNACAMCYVWSSGGTGVYCTPCADYGLWYAAAVGGIRGGLGVIPAVVGSGWVFYGIGWFLCLI